MAAKQHETSHELEDGFVVAWDSSELNPELLEQLDQVLNDLERAIGKEVGDGSPNQDESQVGQASTG